MCSAWWQRCAARCAVDGDCDGQARVRSAGRRRRRWCCWRRCWRRSHSGSSSIRRGPVFFRQQRVGRHGRPFRIHKFRTMVADAPRRGPQLTVGDDPRITRAGAFLRRTKLDELPQLIDVLAGHMSLVGPRPEVPRYVAHVPGRTARQGAGGAPRHHRPGVAGVRRRERTAGPCRRPRARVRRGACCRAKLRAAAAYAEHANLATDLRVIGAHAARAVGAPVRRGRMSDQHVEPALTAWHRLDRFLARLRPHREPLSLAIDGAGDRRLLERHLPVPPRLRALDHGAAGLRRLGDARRGCGVPRRVRCCCGCRRACGASRASARSSA